MPAKCSFNSGEGKPNDHERTFAAGWVAARIPEASGNARGWPREGENRRSRRAAPRGDTSSGPESVARRGGGEEPPSRSTSLHSMKMGAIVSPATGVDREREGGRGRAFWWGFA
jgi:hypothetical protein